MTTEPKETSDCNGFDPRPDNQRQQILKKRQRDRFFTHLLGWSNYFFLLQDSGKQPRKRSLASL